MEKIKASMHLSNSKVINMRVEHFHAASSVWLAMHGKEVPRLFSWTGKSLFSWAAMLLPLAMCPARAGNEFSYWTNGWQRDKPRFLGIVGREGIAHPGGKMVASYSAASFVRRLKVLKVFKGHSIKKPLLFHTLGVQRHI